MPYLIDNTTFATKQAVTSKCRAILNATPLNQAVHADDRAFLLDLFRHHTEWEAKSSTGVGGVVVIMTAHGTRCFCLCSAKVPPWADGGVVDISYVHAIKHLPSAKTASLLPQGLIDFRNGARQAIKCQIDEFRQQQEYQSGLADVDHEFPNTFDALLFEFCHENHINPLHVAVSEQPGCIPHIDDDALRSQWQDYHATHATLRLISRGENLSATKRTMPWSDLLRV